MLCLQDKSSVIVHAEPEGMCDIVVISKQETKIPRSISSRTDLPNLKVLNQEWIVQCLIQGKVVEKSTDFVIPV